MISDHQCSCYSCSEDCYLKVVHLSLFCKLIEKVTRGFATLDITHHIYVLFQIKGIKCIFNQLFVFCPRIFMKVNKL